MQHMNGNEPPQRSLVWLVTGCSSGFGSNIVRAALARGDKVVATARNPSQLEYLQNQSNVAVLQLDVTAPQTVLSDKAQEAVAAFGRIDVLVNNAGYVLSGVWEELR
jgi:NAD(P)-dependent dehydrogenase (short-subunit alcohol dehydrogenase family)